jgi:uncharacterized protein (TIGR02145 family)
VIFENEILDRINQLRREFLDLKESLRLIQDGGNKISQLRGALASAGASAELILKCIYTREVYTKQSNIPEERANILKWKEAQGLMLDELIRKVENRIPLRIVIHLRTIQAWRNVGSHNNGIIEDSIDQGTLQGVYSALSEVVFWFIGDYLNFDLTDFQVPTREEENLTQSLSQIELWREEYWYLQSKLELSDLDNRKLDFLSAKYGLKQEELDLIRQRFRRKYDEFFKVLSTVLNSRASRSDWEFLEFIRLDCCISEREAGVLYLKIMVPGIQINECNLSWITNHDQIVKNEIVDEHGINSNLSNSNVQFSFELFDKEENMTTKKVIESIASDSHIYNKTEAWQNQFLIGHTFWTKVNLSVTKFKNGDQINLAENSNEFKQFCSIKTPAAIILRDIDGRLDYQQLYYNIWALLDKRGICPEGFEIPNVDNWKSLAGRVKIDKKDLLSEMSFDYGCGFRDQIVSKVDRRVKYIRNLLKSDIDEWPSNLNMHNLELNKNCFWWCPDADENLYNITSYQGYRNKYNIVSYDFHKNIFRLFESDRSTLAFPIRVIRQEF